jgi:hypothetical protein
VGTETLQERQFCGLLQRFPCREFHDAVSRFSHEVVHANFILYFGFIQKSLEPSASARFHRIKGGFERFQIGSDVHRTILEPDCIGRVESHQIKFFVDITSKFGEVRFKDIGHPVPTRPHVEGESLFVKNPCPSTGMVVAFQNGDLSAQRGKLCGGGNSGKAGAYDQGITSVMAGISLLHGCKTTSIRAMFNTNIEIVRTFLIRSARNATFAPWKRSAAIYHHLRFWGAPRRCGVVRRWHHWPNRVAQGKRVAIVDLTRGELGTLVVTPATRAK